MQWQKERKKIMQMNFNDSGDNCSIILLLTTTMNIILLLNMTTVITMDIVLFLTITLKEKQKTATVMRTVRST
jgi:hypothetical protein